MKTEPNQALQTTTRTAKISTEPLGVSPHEISDLKRWAEIMKLVALIILPLPTLAISVSDLPHVSGLYNRIVFDHRKNITAETQHPWSPKQGLPTRLEDIGLTRPVEVVQSDIALDGGSRIYALKDYRGSYFLIRTESPAFFDEATKSLLYRNQVRFRIGIDHLPNTETAFVPLGSQSETFLIGLLKECVLKAQNEK